MINLERTRHELARPLGVAALLWATAGCGAAGETAMTPETQAANDSAEAALPAGYAMPEIIDNRQTGDTVWFDLSAALDAKTLRLDLTEFTVHRATADGGRHPVNLAAEGQLMDDGHTLGVRLRDAPVAGEAYIVRIATDDAEGLHYFDLASIRAVEGVAGENEISVDAVEIHHVVPKHAIPGGQTHLETIGMRNRTMTYPLEVGSAEVPRELGRIALKFRSADDLPALIPCANGVPVSPITISLTPKVIFSGKYTIPAHRMTITCLEQHGNSETVFVQLPGSGVLVGGADYDMRIQAQTTRGAVDENVQLISENPSLHVAVVKVDSWLDKNCDKALISRNKRCDLYIPFAGAWRECSGEGGACAPDTANWHSAALLADRRIPASGKWEDISLGTMKTITDGDLLHSSGPVSDVVSLYAVAMDDNRASSGAAAALKISGAVADGVGELVGTAWAPAALIGGAVEKVLGSIETALSGRGEEVIGKKDITLTRYSWNGTHRWGLDLTGPRNVNGKLEWNWWSINSPKGQVWVQLSISEVPASFVP
jgi:hypothetical protein